MSDNPGSQMNAKRLLEDVHALVKMLRSRESVGQARGVVPASRDGNGEHQRTQRQLKTVLQMLQPAAAGQDEWTEPVGHVVMPKKAEESAQRQAANARGANIRDASDLSPRMRRRIRGDLHALENGESVPEVEMIESTASTSSNSDGGDLEYNRVELSLADVLSWKCRAPYEKEREGRARSGTVTKSAEAYLPMAFMQDALEQIWLILNELDLGIPYEGDSPHDAL